ncbi:hypothetical protein NDR87_26405 [Nocardia sp. CDC159]|uniref:Head-to-tail adaptor n=1 Tax=Nocardia pulmonis TaxID=2951408 RepID=A0A9X2E7E7_9NOCA|nr:MULTISPECIES: hypothetical protein [Nocardia]MCM6774980.1 hypothetical protein [Nocardia pulmonis]MCM6789911.1 hypothetical protein [Nocardia sp. CDC159]
MSCQWPIDRSCWPELCSPIDKQRMQYAADCAVFVLWALTGRQFGVCPVLARPCPIPDADPLLGYVPIGPGSSGYYGSPGWFPVWEGGAWRNISCGCPDRCSRTGMAVVHLPGPVRTVDAVTIAGGALADTEWALEGDYLYRTGGAQWPRQNLRAPLGEPGTWSVAYQRGYPPPPGAQTHVGQLALEFFNACSGGKCRLPKRVQTVARQGVSMQMIDPNDLFGAGLTGIDTIDLWIRAINPARLQAAPTAR